MKGDIFVSFNGWNHQCLFYPGERSTPEDGLNLLSLIKYAAVLVAAVIIGNWFLTEARKAKTRQEPWYKPYLSLPGLIILAALSLPLILFLIAE